MFLRRIIPLCKACLMVPTKCYYSIRILLSCNIILYVMAHWFTILILTEKRTFFLRIFPFLKCEFSSCHMPGNRFRSHSRGSENQNFLRRPTMVGDMFRHSAIFEKGPGFLHLAPLTKYLLLRLWMQIQKKYPILKIHIQLMSSIIPTYYKRFT